MADNDLLFRVREAAEEYYPKVKEWREHIHRHPELSFQEKETTAYIADILQQEGITDIDFPTDTGLVAHLKGREKGNRTLALRADIDALPIREKNEHAKYRSVNEGVMHACGHDAHTSSLLGTALIMKKLIGHWGGHLKLIFQPGEERMPGGASEMIRQGVLKDPDVGTILGQHVYPFLKAGQLGFRPGMYMASCDEVYIRVHGKGGHAALPERNVDPVAIGAQLIGNLQHIVSRKAPPAQPTVLSFGRFIAEGATNVIPDTAEISGTFRAMNEDWRAEVHQLIGEISRSTCESMGARAEVNIVKGYPYLENDPQLTQFMRERAVEYVGEENVRDLDIWMGGEDFSYYSHETTACFYRFGTASDDGTHGHAVHTADFDIDPTALKTSSGFMAWAALANLSIIPA